MVVGLAAGAQAALPEAGAAWLPPVMARGAAPERTIQNAWPMACDADEHAEPVETAVAAAPGHHDEPSRDVDPEDIPF